MKRRCRSYRVAVQVCTHTSSGGVFSCSEFSPTSAIIIVFDLSHSDRFSVIGFMLKLLIHLDLSFVYGDTYESIYSLVHLDIWELLGCSWDLSLMHEPAIWSLVPMMRHFAQFWCLEERLGPALAECARLCLLSMRDRALEGVGMRARTSGTRLNKYRKSGQPCFLPDFSGIISSFSPFNMILAVTLL
ncbi:hypothetical protein STEG23_000679 [Scotinomys teguina]